MTCTSEPQNLPLRAAVDSYYTGTPRTEQLRTAMDGALLVVPAFQERALCIAERDGICWILAFTTHRALHDFSHGRGDLGPDWTPLLIRGYRLLGDCATAIGATQRTPVGVALDLDSKQPMLFPPPTEPDPDTPTSSRRGGERTGGRGR